MEEWQTIIVERAFEANTKVSRTIDRDILDFLYSSALLAAQRLLLIVGHLFLNSAK